MRTRLPDRRLLLGCSIEWPPCSGRAWSIQAGFDARLQVREIFGDGPKSGTDMHAVLDDGCILASLALQHGATIAELAHIVSREATRPPDAPAAPAASIVSAAIEAAAQLERWVREELEQLPAVPYGGAGGVGGAAAGAADPP